MGIWGGWAVEMEGMGERGLGWRGRGVLDIVGVPSGAKAEV